MVWVEDGRDWGSEERFRKVARTATYECGGYGACVAEYVVFDCEVEISLVLMPCFCIFCRGGDSGRIHCAFLSTELVGDPFYTLWSWFCLYPPTHNCNQEMISSIHREICGL